MCIWHSDFIGALNTCSSECKFVAGKIQRARTLLSEFKMVSHVTYTCEFAALLIPSTFLPTTSLGDDACNSSGTKLKTVGVKLGHMRGTTNSGYTNEMPAFRRAYNPLIFSSIWRDSDPARLTVGPICVDPSSPRAN